MRKRLFAALVKSVVLVSALLSIGVQSAPITAGNLVIYRVGDGAAALSANGAAVFLDEYSPTGTLVQSIAVPTTTVGANRRLVASGSATSEGAINRSQDGLYIVLPGYDAAPGTASLTTSTSATVNRVIGRLAVNGTLDTTTALSDAISGGNPRGVASTNGTDLWLTGTSGGGGIRYATLGATTSTSLATTPTNLRVAGIANGQLYTSSQSGAFRLATVGTGTPTTAGQTITNLPGFPTATGSPYAFFFADLDAGVAGNDTLYVADDGGTIQKYSLVSGSWTLNGTIAATSVRGLTATVSGTTVTMFVTYSAGAKFATVVDSAGYNAAPTTTTVTDRATAPTNTAFRGIALAPSNSVPSTITANASTTPQTATISTAFTNALAVTVRDASSNPLSGVNVTFTAPGSGASGTFSNSTATITVATNASGVASAPFTANATAGAYNVSAAVSGLSAINFALTNTAGTAASMTANSGTTPQTVTTSSAFANALAVTVRDAGSNPVSGVNVTFTAPGSGASGAFSNSTTTITVATNASGIASAPFTANANAGGPYNVAASASGVTTVNFAMTNAAGAATSMAANSGTTPQSAAIITAFISALAVTVRDAGNSPVPGVNVTFTAPGAGASGIFSNSTATITVATNASGIAAAPFTANTSIGGPYNVSAAAAGLTTINFALTNTVGAAASMAANASTTPQSVAINSALANPLAVTVRDAGSNPVPGVNVTFTAPGSGASGIFSNSTATITVTTNASGIASAPFTANATAGGPYNVSAASAGVTTINFALTNVAGAAVSMGANASTTPQSAATSATFANAPAVTVRDVGNNPVSGVSVTFTAPGSGASGTFSNSTATITVTTNASGVAAAPFTANTTAGGPYVVTAASAGLTAVNFSLTNTAVVASTGSIVISQVYGGGGNGGSVYKNDFIEIFNRGVTPVSLAGWSVQYASATGTSWQVTNLSGTIPGGGYYLVQGAVGAGGSTNLPTPDATGTLALAATAGKVALVNTTAALTGGCPTGTSIVDFVGFGATASCFEGAGATPAPSNTTSVVRLANGCTDSDTNSADFVSSAVTPRNSASPLRSCSPLPGLSIDDVQITEGNSGTSTLTFTVSLTAPAGVGGVTFDIATQDNTAFAGSDYVAKSLSGQTIPAGVTTYTFDVTINGDTAPEADETFYVNVTNLTGANLVKGQGIGTIVKDDAGVNLSINDVSLNEGNSGTTTFSFTVSLSGPAPAGGVTFDIATAPNTATAPSDYTTKILTAQTIPAGMTTYTFDVLVNGDTIGEANETFNVNLTNIVNAIPVKAQGVGTILNDDLYRIHDVQGNSTASPYANALVMVEGIVTGVFQGANSLNGFYIQETDATADADPLTSEGIFVYTNLAPAAVSVGDLVRVSGTVVEFGTAPSTLTEIVTPTVTVLSSGNPLPALVDVTLPMANLADLERYEGMRVRFVQTLTVSDHFDLAHFGEVTLKANGRALQPTNEVDPNDNPASGTTSTGTSNLAAVNAYDNLNARSSIILDDANSKTYPPVIPFIDPVTHTLRLGSTVDNLTGIFSQSFGSYRIFATTPPAFNYAARPLTPPNVGGNVKVASANVLNYFNGDGLGGGFPTSRGANSLIEFNRQRAKTVSVINGLTADVVGLLEMENDGTGPNSAVQDLVNGLNAAAGAGTWAIIPDPAGYCCGNAGTTDEIRPVIIYKPAAVTPVGASQTVVNSAFNLGRAPVAQTFALVSNGERFTLVMNHFKSKGSGGSGADADLGDGQAFYNDTRRQQSQVLLTFLSTLTAATPRIITMGDFNAYEQEDPIDILRAGGLATIINGDTSYMFNGLSGSLDHALGTPTLMGVVSGAGHWHINADEPVFLDYNVETKVTAGCSIASCTSQDFYEASAYRASDHDPVLVGLQLNGAQCVAGTYSANGFVPCTPASAGNFVSNNGATLQTPCTAGTFSSNTGSTLCTPASAGNFVSNNGASLQTPCAAGSFSSNTGATVCTPASAGNFVSTSGATSQTQCVAGAFSSVASASACSPASAGNFVSTAGATAQLPCAAGSFSSTAGASACAPASAGNFVSTSGATSQSPCAAGSFSSAAGATVCTPAAPGSFVATTGAAAQTPCAPGSYASASGATSCTPASVGFFVSATGAITQTLCAAGSTSLVAGASACVPITVTVTPVSGTNGTIAPGTVQTVAFGATSTFSISANPGYSATVAVGAGECGGSLTGSTFTTASVTANCTVRAIFTAIPVQCQAGNFSVTGTAPCTPASPGSFVANSGATSQSRCAAGTFSATSGASACSAATPGNYVASTGATAQTPASPGSFVATAGAASQALCAAGSFSAVSGAITCTGATAGNFVPAAGSTAQTPASAGSFVAVSGASAQTLCAVGTFSPAAGATACTPASLGFFVPVTGATAQTACATGTTTLATGASTCAPILFTVTPIASTNGTILPNTSQSVAFGTTTVFTITANAGYTANVTSGSGTCGGALVNNSYTTVAVKANCNVAVTFTAIPLSQAITGFQPISQVTFGATPVTLAAVGGGSGNPVTFATTSPSTICAVTGSTVSFTGVGTCSLIADQAAATGFTAAPQVTASIVISQASQTINFAPPASLAFGAGSLTLSATASSGLPVTFASSTSATCTVNSTTLTVISAGSCIVTASQSGNGNYQAATSVVRTIVIGDNTSLAPTVPAYRFGEIMNLAFSVAGNNPTGTVSFSTSDGIPIPGCSDLPIVNGTATCIVPSSFSLLNTLPFVATYSGDARNPPTVSYFSRQVQLDQATLSTSVSPVNPVPAGSRASVTALIRMRTPTGTVTFYPATTGAESPVPIPGCDAVPLTLLATATNSAIATCSFTAPQAGNTNIVAVYRYPAGHVSNRIFEQEVQPITVVANAPPNYTDMWWGGVSENGWGVSISQHGATQVNIIFTYDNTGKPIWYLMSGCAWNASNTACTGDLFQPSGSPFSQYDVTRFLVNAPIGSVTFNFKTIGTATMSYRINGVTGTKEIERQIFAGSTNLPSLAVNDLWWNGVAENGWGMNVSQQGMQLFPVWFTYDANGRPTFYFVPGGTWNGLVFTGDLYTATSSAWLGVPYDASKFRANKVGAMSIDFREANTATMTYTVGDFTQTKQIVRQPY